MVQIVSDEERKATVICQQGIEAYNEEDWIEAHQLFEKAYALAPHNATVQSWLGYSFATTQRKAQKGLELCKQAIESQIPDPIFFRNIGAIYIMMNNRKGAIAAFTKGLRIDKGNPKILYEWKRVGIRRKPTLGFLSRNHPINKLLGKFTWRFFYNK